MTPHRLQNRADQCKDHTHNTPDTTIMQSNRLNAEKEYKVGLRPHTT